MSVSAWQRLGEELEVQFTEVCANRSSVHTRQVSTHDIICRELTLYPSLKHLAPPQGTPLQTEA